MVRKTTVEYAENPAGGTGSLEKYHIVCCEDSGGTDYVSSDYLDHYRWI